MVGYLLLLVFASLGDVYVLGNGGFPRTVGQPWPMPQAYISEPDSLIVDQSLVLISSLSECDIIDQAFARYKPYIVQSDCVRSGKVQPPTDERDSNRVDKTDEGKLISLEVDIRGACEKWPTPTSDEQYAIVMNIPSMEGKALIQASTVWGALRGLETFSQLVYDNGDGVRRVNTTLVLDSPRFGFRGMMLDTSRHYLPVRVLLENLEAMAQNKMNVFHWHIVDDPSFPYVSTVFPQLSKLGAFSDKHVYSPQDVAKVIEFARVRGIRVIPEFDTPGHTESWGPGQPQLLTPCYSGGKSTGTFGPVNPTLNSTYDFFQKLFSELSNVFSDQYIHLGGDEVSFDCWKSNPDVLDFMKAQGMGDNFSLLEQFYEQQIVDIMGGLHKNFIVWQEVFDNQVKLDKSTVIHVWKDGYQKELAAVTSAGYNTILSSCWYLNYINYGVDWHAHYTCEPYSFNGTDAQKKMVVGGAACMWGEFVDGVNMMARTWPRASAVAERLWSSVLLTDPDKAAPRLEEHRCRMMQRGLTVEPANGPGYCPCDVYN